MKTWTALMPVNEDARWQMFSANLTAGGIPNEYIPWAGSVEAMSNLGELEKFDHVRVSSGIASHVLKHVKVQSSWTTLLGAVDGMNKTPFGWWPLCALFESFGQVLIELGSNLDTGATVLIAGAGSAARIAIAAFFKAGFRKFLVTNVDEAAAAAFIREIRGKLFGLDLQGVTMNNIVLLPAESSVLINCSPSAESQALLTELSYLNFLKRPGLLFDLSRTHEPNILIQEALDVGVRTITGPDIAARTDVLWAKWGFGCEFDLVNYREQLRATTK